MKALIRLLLQKQLKQFDLGLHWLFRVFGWQLVLKHLQYFERICYVLNISGNLQKCLFEICIFASSFDLDKTPQDVLFHQNLHCALWSEHKLTKIWSNKKKVAFKIIDLRSGKRN